MERQQTASLLNETFGQTFEVERFLKFVRELLNSFEVKEKTSEVWGEYKDYIDSYHNYGSYIDPNMKVMDILTVKLKRTDSVDRARTMQRNFIAKYLGNYHKDAALVAFYGDAGEDWRFSFVRMEYNLADNGKVIPELTPAKRYSFLVGANEPNHTCRKQFLALVEEYTRNPTLQELESAFGIEKVTKEFFERYKELFLKLNDSLLKVLSNDKYVQKEFEEKSISVIDFSKKLLGQIVFLYFLQKKGWLGVKINHDWGTGPKDFMKRLFDSEIISYDNFFNDVLEPLFYDALNNPREGDDGYHTLFKCKIPFLNGGLFEPINDYNWIDTKITLSNDIFRDIFKTFDTYNFTVKEDEPLEKEVAVDPEMLGKVFENLLDVIDRKSKGAFYTPREIVHYMCQQSLINYLETNSEILREDIEKFIQLGDLTLANSIRVLQEVDKKQEKLKKGIIPIKVFEEEVKRELEQLNLPKSIITNKELVDKLLQEIKVVDPAVGSGAFPVGMMTEIVKARSILSIFFKSEEQKNRNTYKLKREAIENSLYGVDIDSSAVDIAKLRFWLSLIVDEESIRNIEPLPNLDHKIMCGNSLLEEFEGKKLFDEKLLGEVKKDYSKELLEIGSRIKKLYDSYEGDDFEKELEKLEKERRKIETEARKDKVSSQATLDDSISKRIKESQRKLRELKELQKEFFNQQDRKKKRKLKEDIDRLEWDLIEETLKEEGNSAAMEKLQEYKKNKSKPFFLWKLYFAEVFQRENPGFDVVIGNPPYGFRGVLSAEEKTYFRKERKIIFPTGDIAELFIIIAFNYFLRSEGVLTYIIPKKSLYGESWSNIRQLWCSNDLTFLMDASKAFEKVLLEQASFSINKRNNRNRRIDVGCLNQEWEKVEVFGKFYLNKIFTKNFTNAQIYKGLYSEQLVNKIEEKSVEDSSNLIKAEIGISNITEYFTFEKDGNYPCVKGIDITKWGLKKEKRYLDGKVSKRFIEEYKKDKLIAQEIIAHVENPYPHIVITIFYDNQRRLFNDTCVEIKPLNTELNRKFLLAYLQSRFSNWFCYNFIYNRAIRTMHFINYYVTQLPIPKIIIENDSTQTPLINLVDQILSITKDDDYLDNPDKQAKVKKLEKEIDQLVYKLYELTPEEIKIVEEFGK